MICHVDGAGNFGAAVADVLGDEWAQSVVGKPVLGDGSRAIVDILKSLDVLVKIQRFKHRYPYDWKTDKPVIVTYVFYFSAHHLPYPYTMVSATSQWFANLDDIKGGALKALEDVHFIPPICKS